MALKLKQDAVISKTKYLSYIEAISQDRAVIKILYSTADGINKFNFNDVQKNSDVRTMTSASSHVKDKNSIFSVHVEETKDRGISP